MPGINAYRGFHKKELTAGVVCVILDCCAVALAHKHHQLTWSEHLSVSNQHDCGMPKSDGLLAMTSGHLPTWTKHIAKQFSANTK